VPVVSWTHVCASTPLCYFGPCNDALPGPSCATCKRQHRIGQQRAPQIGVQGSALCVLFTASQLLPPLAAGIWTTNCCLRLAVAQSHSDTFLHVPTQFTGTSSERSNGQYYALERRISAIISARLLPSLRRTTHHAPCPPGKFPIPRVFIFSEKHI
jgi:hypothetical protein